MTTRLRRTLAAVLAASSIALTARHAAADDTDDVARQQAEVSFREGTRLFNLGQYERAWYEFRKANAIYPRGSLLRSLGLCELKMNKPVDALAHFRAALASADLKPDQRPLTEADIDLAYKATGHIAVHADASATIALDGQNLAAMPATPVDVMPGHHVVEARLGARSVKRDVEAPAAAVTDVDVRMPESPSPSSPPVSPTPVSPPSRPDGLPAAHPAPPPSPMGEQPEQRSFFTTRNIVVISVGAAAVASVVAGIAYKVSADDKASLVQTLQGSTGACPGSPQCGDLAQAANDRSTDTNLATGFFIAGGALAATGVALLVFWHDAPPKASAASIHLRPTVGPTTAGLQLTGTF